MLAPDPALASPGSDPMGADAPRQASSNFARRVDTLPLASNGWFPASRPLFCFSKERQSPGQQGTKEGGNVGKTASKEGLWTSNLWPDAFPCRLASLCLTPVGSHPPTWTDMDTRGRTLLKTTDPNTASCAASASLQAHVHGRKLLKRTDPIMPYTTKYPTSTLASLGRAGCLCMRLAATQKTAGLEDRSRVVT